MQELRNLLRSLIWMGGGGCAVGGGSALRRRYECREFLQYIAVAVLIPCLFNEGNHFSVTLIQDKSFLDQYVTDVLPRYQT